MEHTKGPWRVGEYNSFTGETTIYSAEGYLVSLNVTSMDEDLNNQNSLEDQANARLVAAAPDLLAALEAIVSLNPEHDSAEGFNEWGEADCFTQAQKIARDAIAKAK